MTTTFRLPDLGEGLTESEIVTWHVAEGDAVELNQILAEVETAKAVVELPSPYTGRIAALHAGAGQTVAVGAPLIDFEVAGAASGTGGQPEDGATHGENGAHRAEPVTQVPDDDGSTAEERSDSEQGAPEHSAAPGAAEASADDAAPPAQRQSVLVGYGPKITGDARPRRRPRSFEVTPYEREALPEDGAAASAAPVRAMPPVRALARRLGVDLRTVRPTGTDGLVSRADVQAVASGGQAQDAASAPAAPDGRASQRIPVTGLRKHTAQAMTDSAFTAPHASVQSTIDITATVDLLRRVRQQDKGGRSPSFLSVVCRAILRAVQRTPGANSHFDAEAGQIEVFSHVNLGIAVATDRGLVVTSIDDAQDLEAAELTERIGTQAGRARDGSAELAELTSSTLTVTNVGVFDVDSGIPILNPGQSVIVAIGAIRTRPWEHQGQVALRQVVTITVSFDHRVLDGAEASAFLSDITSVLSDPAITLMG